MYMGTLIKCLLIKHLGKADQLLKAEKYCELLFYYPCTVVIQNTMHRLLLATYVASMLQFMMLNKNLIILVTRSALS